MSDYLCDELIVEIFTRLPPKSLLRFRSLSRSFCSLITSSDFIRLHTFQCRQKVLFRHRYMIEHDDLKTFYTLHPQDELPLCPIPLRKYIDTPVQFPIKYFDIVGTCNGILCLLDYEHIFSVWNPSIRRIITPTESPPWIFELLNKSVAVGFCFDSLTNDFKIVRTSNLYKDEERSYVYTLKTDTWFAIATPTATFTHVKSEGCFVNGALHWVVKYLTKEPREIGHQYIMTFNASTHAFGSIELPEPEWDTRELTIVNNSLAVCSSKNDNGLIWVRKGYIHISSWCVIYKLDDKKYELGRVLHLTETDDLLIKSFYSEFQVYNPRTFVEAELEEFNASTCKVDMEIFVESLELLDIMTACEVNQSSFQRGKKKQRTTLDEICKRRTLSSTRLRKMCNFFSSCLRY